LNFSPAFFLAKKMFKKNEMIVKKSFINIRHIAASLTALNCISGLYLTSLSINKRNLNSKRVASDPPSHVQKILKTAKIFCFDVDSTLIQTESIDELASFLGVGDEVRKMTSAAMGGSVNFTEALQKRLDLMRPSEQDMARFLSMHPPELTPGVKPCLDLHICVIWNTQLYTSSLHA
jgi:hypothetical protein